ncbi:MAG: hypothetical protein NTW69_01470, partial [Chloroflexi bacterium]|nr:hypothetical protein [Chloroflexota bacterium]
NYRIYLCLDAAQPTMFTKVFLILPPNYPKRELLISALYFHQITTQIPYEVYVALPKDSEKPRIHHPPTRFFWVSPEPF